MQFYLQKDFVFPRSLVCNIFIHDTNYFVCICASDLDLNLPKIFSCEFVTLFIFTGSSPPPLKNVGINTVCSKEQQFLKGTISYGACFPSEAKQVKIL